MKILNMKIAAELIVHCPWNPRGEITRESVADLTASIRERGLLQDIGVMPIPDSTGHFWAIYGNRRLVACREAGIGLIPCKIYRVGEAEAREITRIENEVRLGIDPIKDSELVKSMLDLGMTEVDIAAHFGVSVPTICRRAKLITLSDDYKAIADKITTAALEQIAAYPADIQKKCFKSVKSYAQYSQVQVGWNNLAHTFDEMSADLDSAHFVKWALKHEDNVPERCRLCTKRTGCMPDLFGELGEDHFLGRCLDLPCFRETEKAFVAKLADMVIDKRATERERVQREWNMPNGVVDRWGKKNPCAYWCYEAYCCETAKDEGIVVKYGPSRAQMEALEKERQAAEEAERKMEQAKRDQLGVIYDKIDEFIEKTPDSTFVAMCLEILGQRESVALRNWFLDCTAEHFIGRCWDGDARNAEFASYFGETIGLTPDEVEVLKREAKPVESTFDDEKQNGKGDDEDGE